MLVSKAFRELGGFLEECESYGRVTDVKFADGPDGDGSLAADVTLTLPLTANDGEPTTLRAVDVAGDGSLRLTLESDEPVVPVGEGPVSVETTGTEIADGTVTVSLTASVPTAAEPAATDSTGGTDGGRQSPAPDPGTTAAIDDGGSKSEPEVPPFRNPELLADVYDRCDTFAEMAETLDMDVTAETVRRYMIDYDIHQPNSYDTGDDAPAGDKRASADRTGEEPTAGAGDGTETPVILADGVGLPEDITVETLIETVRRSNTIYEVKQDMGLERDDALEVLRELNLLDIVVGRLATEAERDISRDEIIGRLQQLPQG
ncbi:hypothetical protein [Halobaculum gomorrense]|uniref:Uncharacterized protein n=1 Tax=Halobaculum gomorrense TaxID=43928 RepID=A0A1M5PBV2_9EURY|nr:hypothetical protein [Halobaculum gomorrense]SHG99236.1 hypothetical protein SAMN05443636_1539 [Halobaculum gomorrense]